MEIDTLPPLAIVDIVALCVVAIGGIQGYLRGLSGELARLIGTIFAFVSGVMLHGPVGEWILANTRLTGQIAHAVAFIATVVLAILILIALRLIVKRLMKIVFAEGFDKTMGILAGLLRMSIAVCIVFLIMNLVPSPYLNRHFGESSMIGSIVIRYVPTIQETLQEVKVPSTPETPEPDNHKK